MKKYRFLKCNSRVEIEDKQFITIKYMYYITLK
jgi:hypothetical protein